MADYEYFKQRPQVNPTIYAYCLEGVESHKGYIKVGYTDRDADTRIREQLHTSAVPYKILLTESAMCSDGSCFTDHDVHNILKRNGFRQLNQGEDRNEWFFCSVNDVRAAINELKNGEIFNAVRTENFEMRPEQTRAVMRTVEYYKSAIKDDPTRAPKFLWNAKMRFGKTFAAYQLCKKMGFKRILVLTFKPAVESAWHEDLQTHVDFEGWQFISNKDARNNNIDIDCAFRNADKSKPIVVFGSFQDLLGTNENGGIKAKNEFIHTEVWDIVIFDEYHFGAWRENARKLFENPDEEADADFDMEKYQNEEAGNAYNETFLPISTSYYLYLSGTPFRAINSGEFIEEQIFNWTYSDEQREKYAWVGANNPYISLPRMVMMTYKMPDEIRQVALQGEFDEFDLNVFFSAKGKGDEARFVYENEVQKWLDLIRGQHLPTNIDDLKMQAKKNERPPMPYSDTRLLNVLSHTLWFLPNVSSCFAMYNLLQQKQNTFYHDYKINVCAGTRAGIGLDAVKPVINSMGNPLKTKTITLTCGKLTTGITVKPWTGIFMLRNLKSPETYFQAAFRVQSPWTIKNDKGKTEIMKQECYVFDFALDRALRQISDYSCRLNVDETDPEKKVSEFISFLPVLAYDGSSMKAINAQDVLDIAMAGTSATLLARRWESALLVNVDNDTLKRLTENKEALDALMRIEGFRSLNSDIETIINKSEAVKKAKKDDEDKLSAKEKKQLTDDEKESKSLRKQIQEKLIKFATRVPIFMYLTDEREKCLKDVITEISPQLFKKVTGLDVKDFEMLCTMGLFNSNLMNQAIYQFKRYEDASLVYTGIDAHDEDEIGGWDTSIRREEYNRLFYNQQASMAADEREEDIPEPIKPALNPKPISAKPQSVTAQFGFKSPEPEKPKPMASKKEPEIKAPEVTVGMKVYHKAFKDGTVVKFDGKFVTVKFDMGEKKFMYPAGFIGGFLEIKL
ncbi:GIY-YIG nuclease family protein [Huintestinicola butyrica]|uniref:GIY-YIG nuclease family protein n=1 Tax=Huintestinicola butyrica TaxID=2981728 RepID=UPI003F809D1D